MKSTEISYAVRWQKALGAIESNDRLTVRDTLGILETIAQGEIPAKYSEVKNLYAVLGARLSEGENFVVDRNELLFVLEKIEFGESYHLSKLGHC